MDPQENARLKTPDEGQTNVTPQADNMAATQANDTSLGNRPTMPVADTTGTTSDAANGATPNMEVDLSNPTANSSATTDSGNLSGSGAEPIPGPAEVAFNDDPAQPSITSETPTPAVSPTATTTSDTGSAPSDAPLSPVAAPPLGETPATDANAVPDATQSVDQPASGVPATAPVPAHHITDKKTVIILAGVALVLIGAILFLFFK